MLVDTSVWIDHFRQGNTTLAGLLENGAVWSHPFVVGELACGNLRRRAEALGLLDSLPVPSVATDEEVRHLVESRQLFGRGLGWVDVHLLASATLSATLLWTLDRPLHQAAIELRIAASVPAEQRPRRPPP